MAQPDKREWGNKFLYSEDLLHGGQFQSPTVEIGIVHEAGTITRADGKKVDKRSISFANKEKLLVLCKSNERLIAYATGESDPAKWPGKQIKLVVRIVEAFGADVAAIRVWPGRTVRKSLLKQLGKDANDEQRPNGKPKYAVSYTMGDDTMDVEA